MKFLRITYAEIKKILFRPTFFVMMACLFVAIVVSAFLFNPTTREGYTSQVSGSNLTNIYNAFNREGQPENDGKIFTHNFVEERFAVAQNFNETDKLEELKTQVCVIFKSRFDQLEDGVLHANFNTALLENLYNSSGVLLTYFDQIQKAEQPYNFLIKSADFESFNNLLRSMRSTMPSTQSAIEELKNDAEKLATICRSIYNGYKSDIQKMVASCNTIKKLKLSDNFLSQVALFKQSVLDYLQEKELQIDEFYQQNMLQVYDANTILRFKDILNDYTAGAQISALALRNMIDLERLSLAGGDSGSYLGFGGVSLFKLKEDTSFYKYIIDSKIDFSSALVGLNFGTNSGLKTNGYDFAVHLLTVASLMINLILIYFACMTFSGERHDGLMRMNLTKPISRTKLYFAKICALLLMSFVAHLVLGLVFMAIGAAIYGTAAGSVMIAVFNATSPYAIAPFGGLLLQVFTLFLASAFYILLASMISNLFANPVFSVVVSYLVYAFALITNSLLSSTAFVKFLPFIHAQSTFFFGGGTWGQGFLSSAIYSGASFALTLIYFLVACGLFVFGGCYAMKKQEL